LRPADGRAIDSRQPRAAQLLLPPAASKLANGANFMLFAPNTQSAASGMIDLAIYYY